MKPTEVYAKMDWEGGFWELVQHSGTGFLVGTPYEDKIDLIRQAANLAFEISNYFEDIAVYEEDY